jgi:hypothetical protein
MRMPETGDEAHQYFDNLVLSMQLVIQAGADPTSSDHCRCACSPRGCTPLSFLQGLDRFGSVSSSSAFELRIVIEWVLALARYSEDWALWDYLEHFHRFHAFSEFETTHVCCASRTKWSRGVASDDMEEILDEEEEIILRVEQRVFHFRGRVQKGILEG